MTIVLTMFKLQENLTQELTEQCQFVIISTTEVNI